MHSLYGVGNAMLMQAAKTFLRVADAFQRTGHYIIHGLKAILFFVFTFRSCYDSGFYPLSVRRCCHLYIDALFTSRLPTWAVGTAHPQAPDLQHEAFACIDLQMAEMWHRCIILVVRDVASICRASRFKLVNLQLWVKFDKVRRLDQCCVSIHSKFGRKLFIQ